MKNSNILAPMASLALVAVSLNACSNAGSQFSPPAATTLSTQGRHQTGPQPASCVPKLWTSSLSTNAVYGYVAANSPPCITLNGTYATLPLNAPTTLAVWKKFLYVADLGNNRIVVFTITGSYVKYLSTKLSNGSSYQPWGVCVSKTGVVGAGNRDGTDVNGNSIDGNVEFWPANAISGSGPTGWGSTILQAGGFCAFDKKNNFFVDGAAYSGNGGGQQIAYLAQNHVNAPNQTLCSSGLGNANWWMGMYSRIDAPADQTLSVGAGVGNATSESVYNWTVAGASNCGLIFTPLPTYAFGTYPSTIDPVYQLAPSRGGATGSLFIADYGDNVTLKGGAAGPTVATFESVSKTTGVATQPEGQY